MPVRCRADAVCLHVSEIRKLLPGRKIVRLHCPRCGRPCHLVFKHPNDPEEWTCQVCQQFTKGHNGQYALGELARARNMLDRITRERMQQHGAEDAQPAASRRRTRKEEPGD